MNPCEKILEMMNPAIRAYHADRWLSEAPPRSAEELYAEYLGRHNAE